MTKASSSRSSRVAKTGRRPINSGIRPYLTKSPGSTSFKISELDTSFVLIISAPKPIEDPVFLLEISLSKPANAPPHIKSILVVST